MREIYDAECKVVNGGIWAIVGRFVLGSIIGLGGYALKKKHNDEPMTPEGAATAASFGAVTGGVGGTLAKAAGGGIVGNVAWRPGMLAVNAAGQAIADQQD